MGGMGQMPPPPMQGMPPPGHQPGMMPNDMGGSRTEGMGNPMGGHQGGDMFRMPGGPGGMGGSFDEGNRGPQGGMFRPGGMGGSFEDMGSRKEAHGSFEGMFNRPEGGSREMGGQQGGGMFRMSGDQKGSMGAGHDGQNATGGFNTGSQGPTDIPGLQMLMDFADQNEEEEETSLSEKEVKAITTLADKMTKPLATLEKSWKKLQGKLSTMNKKKAVSEAYKLGGKVEQTCSKIDVVAENVSDVALMVDNTSVDAAEAKLEDAAERCATMLEALMDAAGVQQSDQ